MRAVVRSETQVPKIKKAVAKLIHEPKVEYVIVNDLTNSDAFDGLLQGVDFIFHIASPMNMSPVC